MQHRDAVDDDESDEEVRWDTDNGARAWDELLRCYRKNLEERVLGSRTAAAAAQKGAGAPPPATTTSQPCDADPSPIDALQGPLFPSAPLQPSSLDDLSQCTDATQPTDLPHFASGSGGSPQQGSRPTRQLVDTSGAGTLSVTPKSLAAAAAAAAAGGVGAAHLSCASSSDDFLEFFPEWKPAVPQEEVLLQPDPAPAGRGKKALGARRVAATARQVLERSNIENRRIVEIGDFPPSQHGPPRGGRGALSHDAIADPGPTPRAAVLTPPPPPAGRRPRELIDSHLDALAERVAPPARGGGARRGGVRVGGASQQTGGRPDDRIVSASPGLTPAGVGGLGHDPVLTPGSVVRSAAEKVSVSGAEAPPSDPIDEGDDGFVSNQVRLGDQIEVDWDDDYDGGQAGGQNRNQQQQQQNWHNRQPRFGMPQHAAAASNLSMLQRPGGGGMGVGVGASPARPLSGAKRPRSEAAHQALQEKLKRQRQRERNLESFAAMALDGNPLNNTLMFSTAKGFAATPGRAAAAAATSASAAPPGGTDALERVGSEDMIDSQDDPLLANADASRLQQRRVANFQRLQKWEVEEGEATRLPDREVLQQQLQQLPYISEHGLAAAKGYFLPAAQRAAAAPPPAEGGADPAGQKCSAKTNAVLSPHFAHFVADEISRRFRVAHSALRVKGFGQLTGFLQRVVKNLSHANNLRVRYVQDALNRLAQRVRRGGGGGGAATSSRLSDNDISQEISRILQSDHTARGAASGVAVAGVALSGPLSSSASNPSLASGPPPPLRLRLQKPLGRSEERKTGDAPHRCVVCRRVVEEGVGPTACPIAASDTVHVLLTTHQTAVLAPLAEGDDLIVFAPYSIREVCLGRSVVTGADIVQPVRNSAPDTEAGGGGGGGGVGAHQALMLNLALNTGGSGQLLGSRGGAGSSSLHHSTPDVPEWDVVVGDDYEIAPEMWSRIDAMIRESTVDG